MECVNANNLLLAFLIGWSALSALASVAGVIWLSNKYKARFEPRGTVDAEGNVTSSGGISAASAGVWMLVLMLVAAIVFIIVQAIG